MVKKPVFKLDGNGSGFKDGVKTIEFLDNDGVKDDQITIRIVGDYQRPKFEDEIKLYLGYENEAMFFAGTFKVQTSKRINNLELIITATGTDYSKKLKEKKSKTWENLSLKDICSQIAGEHGLKPKSDFDDVFIKNLLQTNESDLNFLERLSKEYNSVFNIKNNTLVFIKNNKHNQENSSLPIFSLSAKEATTIEITHTSKKLYKSCVAKWHDTKENKQKKIKVGGGEPAIEINGHYKDEAEAKVKAEAKLAVVNRGTVRGVFQSEGQEIYAGGNIELTDTVNQEDDGKYSIKSVRHKFSEKGWSINVEFENITKATT